MRSARFPTELILLSLLLMAVLTRPVDAVGAQLGLTWVDASADEAGFSVERSAGGADSFDVIDTTGPGVSAYTDTTVADGTTYCYRVRAFNAVAYSEYSYPACATTAPAALTVALHINQQVFAPGDRFQLDVTVAQDGSTADTDVYVGSVLPPAGAPAPDCPDGEARVYVVDAPAGLDGLVSGCAFGEGVNAVPLYSGIAAADLPARMGANLFSFTWPPPSPGDYTVFVILTEAGTTNVLAQGTATISAIP